MTDQSADADRDSAGRSDAEQIGPDYELADSLALHDPAQYRALFEDTRQAIVRLLNERAATITELAAAMDKPKGTIGHHMKVLAEAGLVQVVRTERVRALEAKYWGRTARIFFYDRVGEASTHGSRLLQGAAADIGRAETLAAAEPTVAGVIDANRRDVRVSHERAHEFRVRLADLLLEFAAEPRTGETTYAVVFGIFPSGAPSLPASKEPKA